MAIALAFDLHYHVYIEATFGIRRLREATSLGLIIIALGVFEDCRAACPPPGPADDRGFRGHRRRAGRVAAPDQ